MVGNLQRITLDGTIILKSRHCNFQNGKNNMLECFPRPLFAAQLLGRVGSVIVARDGQYRFSIVVVETDGTLVARLLLLLINIKLAAQVKRKIEAAGYDLLPNHFQILDVFHLQIPKRGILDLNRSNNLCSSEN